MKVAFNIELAIGLTFLGGELSDIGGIESFI
jgi:hypothetical protein